jgi:hypothetical protein
MSAFLMTAVLPLVLHKRQKMVDWKPLARDVDPFQKQLPSEHIVRAIGVSINQWEQSFPHVNWF